MPNGESQAYTRDARSLADMRLCTACGPGTSPGPFAASCGGNRVVETGRVDDRSFFRRVVVLPIDRRCDANSKILAAACAGATARLVVIRFDLAVQAHLAGTRHGVLRAKRIVDDLVTGERGVVVALRPDGAAVPTDVVGLLHRRE